MIYFLLVVLTGGPCSHNLPLCGKGSDAAAQLGAAKGWAQTEDRLQEKQCHISGSGFLCKLFPLRCHFLC